MSVRAAIFLAGAVLGACGGGAPCGPTEGTVARAIDGDTIELDDGTRVRYLLVDTPESTNGATDCFGENAHRFNEDLVVGRTVQLDYDVECTDRYDRLLAYVTVDGTEVNSLLVEQGYACVLHIPPNGDDRADAFAALEADARAHRRGMWGVCQEITCE